VDGARRAQRRRRDSRAIGGGKIRLKECWTMNFQAKTMVYRTRSRWLVLPTPTSHGSKPVRTKPFTVYQPVPGQNFPKPLFTVYAYSIEQARAIVAAKVAGETIVVAVRVVPLTSPLLTALDGAAR
jgi:hypothetical protein